MLHRVSMWHSRQDSEFLAFQALQALHNEYSTWSSSPRFCNQYIRVAGIHNTSRIQLDLLVGVLARWFSRVTPRWLLEISTYIMISISDLPRCYSMICEYSLSTSHTRRTDARFYVLIDESRNSVRESPRRDGMDAGMTLNPLDQCSLPSRQCSGVRYEIAALWVQIRTTCIWRYHLRRNSSRDLISNGICRIYVSLYVAYLGLLLRAWSCYVTCNVDPSVLSPVDSPNIFWIDVVSRAESIHMHVENFGR